MKNFLFYISRITLFVSLLIFSFSSCKDDDCEVLDKDLVSLYRSGGSATVNGEYMEFQGARFGLANNGKHSLFIGNGIWYQNTIWVERNTISIGNLDLIIGDTMVLHHELPGMRTKLSAIFHTSVGDGDASAECYEIMETEDFPSWIVITEHHQDAGEIAGALQAAFIISDECPQKDDPADPDTIYVKDCLFRAIEVE